MRIKKLSTSPQRLRTNSTGSAYGNQKVLTVQWREKKDEDWNIYLTFCHAQMKT